MPARWLISFYSILTGVLLFGLGLRTRRAAHQEPFPGYPRQELMHLHWAGLTHPDDLAADVAQFDRVMAGEQNGYVLEKRFIRKDGQAVWCTMAAQCVRAPDGSAEFFVGLVHDMTERLQADEALRRAREQLTHSRVAAMGELVASIAHEISRPLVAIVANSHATARWLAAQPPNHGEAEAAVQRIVADAHRVSEVVAGIRRLLRRSDPQRAPVDLHALVCGVARMLESAARTRHVRLQVEPRRGEAPGNGVQFQQVILNLAMKGFDAMATVPEANRCLRMAVEVEGRHAVRVDTGGLAADRPECAAAPGARGGDDPWLERQWVHLRRWRQQRRHSTSR